MDQDADREAINAAQAAYGVASQSLAVRCGAMFADGDVAAHRLLEIAEELGAGEAVARLVANPADFGVSEVGVGDRLDTGGFEEAVEAVLSAQDRLDTATTARTGRLRQAEPNRLQTVHFGGREFVLDPGRGEIRSVDDPAERYLAPELANSASAPDRQPPRLTEEIAREAHTAPARARPASPDRSR